MRASRSSAGNMRWPLMTRAPFLDDGFDLVRDRRPGSATKIKKLRSVSSTSIGGSQLGSRRSAGGCRLKNCWCIRSARASDLDRVGNIQLTGFFGGIAFLRHIDPTRGYRCCLTRLAFLEPRSRPAFHDCGHW